MAFLGIELDNNIEIRRLIDVMVNELKSSYVLEFAPEEETKLFVKGNNLFTPEDLKEVVRSITK